MTFIVKNFFKNMRGNLKLPVLPKISKILFFVFAVISFYVSYYIVGKLYKARVISGKIAGSISFSIVYFLVFSALWFITTCFIRAWQFCTTHWVAIVSAFCVLILCVIFGFVIFHKLKGGKHNA